MQVETKYICSDTGGDLTGPLPKYYPYGGYGVPPPLGWIVDAGFFRCPAKFILALRCFRFAVPDPCLLIGMCSVASVS